MPSDARGTPVLEVRPPAPVRAWLHTGDRQVRVDAHAIAATPDAVLVQWGVGQAATAAWVWRAAVKHRAS